MAACWLGQLQDECLHGALVCVAAAARHMAAGKQGSRVTEGNREAMQLKRSAGAGGELAGTATLLLTVVSCKHLCNGLGLAAAVAPAAPTFVSTNTMHAHQSSPSAAAASTAAACAAAAAWPSAPSSSAAVVPFTPMQRRLSASSSCSSRATLSVSSGGPCQGATSAGRSSGHACGVHTQQGWVGDDISKKVRLVRVSGRDRGWGGKARVQWHVQHEKAGWNVCSFLSHGCCFVVAYSVQLCASRDSSNCKATWTASRVASLAAAAAHTNDDTANHRAHLCLQLCEGHAPQQQLRKALQAARAARLSSTAARAATCVAWHNTGQE